MGGLQIELVPVYDTRKSFYHKAFYTDERGGKEKKLYSYNTYVCKIEVFFDEETFKEKQRITLNTSIREDLLFSNTTLRHIKEFIRQNTNIKVLSKSMLEKGVLEVDY